MTLLYMVLMILSKILTTLIYSLLRTSIIKKPSLIVTWHTQNKLLINKSKTKNDYIPYATETCCIPKITIMAEEIEVVNYFKFLCHNQ